jgi:hypothetical protein
MRQLFMGVLLGAGGPRSRFGTSDDGSADNNRRQNVLQPHLRRRGPKTQEK